MPFTTESLVCGLLGGVLISLIFNGFVRVFRWLFGRKKLVESDNEKK
jgi:hypothetical protein